MKNLLAALAIAAIAGVTTQSCDCKKPCDCEPCEKTAWTAPPAIAEPLADLAVGAPPDILHLASGTITADEPLQTTLVAIAAQYTEPQPTTPPSPAPRPPQPPPAAGHWQTQYVGLRGRRTRNVWIPAGGACAACR